MPVEPWTRPKFTPRELPKSKRPRPVYTVFYGYPADVVAQVCQVKKSTAYSYKNGHRKPSAQALKLMQLHAAGRILDPKHWPGGWRIHQDSMIDPEGYSTSERHLRGYAMLIQAMMHHVRKDPALQAEIEPILRIMEGGKRRA